MKRIILQPGEEKRILGGHPWVYGNEIARILGPAGPTQLEPGEIADIEGAGKHYLGRAFVNPNSKITARIYSPSKEGVDKGFFKRRIRQALARRYHYDLYRESVRILFAEADLLPGLILDRFVGWPLDAVEKAIPERPFTFAMAEDLLGPPLSWIAAQFLIFGMDTRREEIILALEEVLAKDNPSGKDRVPLGIPAGIIEKSSSRVRELEGLPYRKGLIKGTFPAGGIVIFENGIPLCVQLEEGQKTGHFLDQRENRRRIPRFIPRGAQVLDACTYTGGFGIHAARFSAASVQGVDVSKDALKTAEQNIRLNGVEAQMSLAEGDIFDVLRSYSRDPGKQFDCIILDPPAFAKSRAMLPDALRGYKEINLQALKLLRPGGILLTCSCSHALDETRFKQMVAEAAGDAERRLIQLNFCYQAPDHPILLGYDESLYLKAGYYRVL